MEVDSAPKNAEADERGAKDLHAVPEILHSHILVAGVPVVVAV